HEQAEPDQPESPRGEDERLYGGDDRLRKGKGGPPGHRREKGQSVAGAEPGASIGSDSCSRHGELPPCLTTPRDGRPRGLWGESGLPLGGRRRPLPSKFRPESGRVPRSGTAASPRGRTAPASGSPWRGRGREAGCP